MRQPMKSAFSKLRSCSSGSVALEFAVVLVTFFTLFFVLCDLGRFYLITHSIRTLVSEMARETLIYCANQSNTTTCILPPSGAHSIATAENGVIGTSNLTTVTATRSAATTTVPTGVMTVTATASTSFQPLVPVWPIAMSTISQTYTLTY